MQFTHATSDLSMAEDRLGPERIQTAYAWRTVLDKGGIIIGGSDAPVDGQPLPRPVCRCHPYDPRR